MNDRSAAVVFLSSIVCTSSSSLADTKTPHDYDADRKTPAPPYDPEDAPALLLRPLKGSLADRWRRMVNGVGWIPTPAGDDRPSTTTSSDFWPNVGRRPASMRRHRTESADLYVRRLARYLTLAVACNEGTAAACCRFGS
jgi:hypothetical protein